ncbi:MAG: molybdate ABC transporter substrate-binding protein [Oscillospiraceae bacterium]|jgi:molybdate transport system substrate-binding protein|nr:molybdate ABC transporter substrate-binding protein [Oscillospiraceae bacterium]
MKKLLAILLALTLAFSLFACAKDDADVSPSPSASEPEVSPSATEPAQNLEISGELTVFAAASMTETLTEIEALFKAYAPNVSINFNFESSGTLLKQLQEGAEADIFVSAGQKQMNDLGAENILAGSRFDLVENRVALVVPAGNPGSIKSFDDAVAAGSIALGDSSVPVGQYAQEIFESLGVWEQVSAKATLAGNVKEVTTQVKEGAVDCGIVYVTDANSEPGIEIVAFAPEGTLATPVLYPAAVLAQSQNGAAATAFLGFLTTDAAIAVFESVDFVVVASRG